MIIRDGNQAFGDSRVIGVWSDLSRSLQLIRADKDVIVYLYFTQLVPHIGRGNVTGTKALVTVAHSVLILVNTRDSI